VNRQPTSDDVVFAVCRASGLSRRRLVSKAKSYEIAHPRQLATLLIRQHCPTMSTTKIALKFRQDHTTVIHSIKAAGTRLAADPEYRALYRRALDLLVQPRPRITPALVPPISILPVGADWRRTKWLPRARPATGPLWTKPKAKHKHVAKMRDCLRCGTAFLSTWPGERVCATCKGTEDWKDGEEPYSGRCAL
jgi:hypothetical protein